MTELKSQNEIFIKTIKQFHLFTICLVLTIVESVFPYVNITKNTVSEIYRLIYSK